MMTDDEAILIHQDYQSYQLFQLNRPKQLNAFTADLHQKFYQGLQKAGENEQCRAIIITGSGRGFCAGQDLGERNPSQREGKADLGETIEKYYNPLVNLIRNINKPIICAVNGVAAGAGANLAFACDFVLAAQSAKFIQSFCKLGLVPDTGGTYTLTHTIGEARAKELTMLGEPLMAEKAYEWGLIYRVCPDDKLLDEATLLAKKFAKAATYGLGLTKQAIHEAQHQTFEEQLLLERDFQRKAGYSPDYDEGVSAFLEKRDPNYTGKAK